MAQGNLRRMAGATCVFCAASSSPAGEHVWPRWFLKMFGDDTYHLEVNGVPQLKRNGEVRTTSQLLGTRVPMCVPCNGILDRRFEKTTKLIVRTAHAAKADDRWAKLDPSQQVALAEWILKVGLLSKHPSARFDDPVMDGAVERWPDADPDLYLWMTSGEPPPDGLSVFVTRSHDLIPPDPVGTLHLPHTLIHGGTFSTFRHTTFNVLDLHVDIVYHPHWPLQHPLSLAAVVQLWPVGARPADLHGLSFRNPRDVGYLVSGRVVLDGDGSSGLPPLTVSLDRAFLVETGLAKLVTY